MHERGTAEWNGEGGQEHWGQEHFRRIFLPPILLPISPFRVFSGFIASSSPQRGDQFVELVGLSQLNRVGDAGGVERRDGVGVGGAVGRGAGEGLWRWRRRVVGR